MKELLKSLKEIARELLLIAYILIVFLAAFVPIWTSTGGKFYKTIESESTAMESRDAIAFYQLKNEGTFIWQK